MEDGAVGAVRAHGVLALLIVEWANNSENEFASK